MANDWEDVAPSSSDDGWETVPTQASAIPSGGWEDIGPELARRGKAALGGVDAALNMAAGLPAYIHGGLQGLGTFMATGDIDKAVKEYHQRTESNFGLGAPKPFTKEGAEVEEMLSTGLEKAKEEVGKGGYTLGGEPGRALAEGTTEALANFLPIPGAEGLHGVVKRFGERGVGAKVLDGLDKQDAHAAAEEQAKKDLDASRQQLAESLARITDTDIMQKLKSADQQASFNEDLASAHDQSIQNRLGDLNDQLNSREDITNDVNQKLADQTAQQNDQGLVNRLSRLNDAIPEPVDTQRFAAAHDQSIMDNLKRLDEALGPGVDPAQIAKQHDDFIKQRLEALNNSILDKDPARTKQLEDMQTKDLVDRLQKIDDTMSGIEDYNARYASEDLAKRLQEINSQRGHEPIYVDPQGQAFRGDPGELHARQALETQARAYEDGIVNGTEHVAGEPLSGLVDPEKPPRTMDKETQKAIKAAQSETGVNRKAIRNTGKRGRQTGAVDLSVLREGVHVAIRGIEDALKKIPIHNHLTADAISTLKEIYGQSEDPQVISFARKEYRNLGYPMDVLSAFDKAIVAAHQLRLEQARANVIPFRPRGQRGGVSLDLLTLGLLPKGNAVREIMKAQKDGSFIPDNPKPEDFQKGIEQARNEADTTNSWKNTASGAVLEAAKRGSTAIRMLSDLMLGAFKRADLAIRQTVSPAEKALRGLSRSEIKTLHQVMKREMFNGKQYSEAQLRGFTPKLLNAYRAMREMYAESIKVQNEARAAKGQPPVTPIEAYLSSRWQGDFRRPLYDSNGKLVWYLASDSKRGLNAQTRAILKDNPTLVYDPKKDHVVRFRNRKTDLQSAYTTMLDILGRDDPAVAKIKQYMEDQTAGQGATYLNQEKHFKSKGNIRGFVGDRPKLTLADFTDKNIPGADLVKVAHGDFNEAMDFFHQQVQYGKNAMRWSEIQKVSDQVKKLINDPVITDKQPNNRKYMLDYYKHAIGYGEAEGMRAIEDGLRDFGLSPDLFSRGVGGLKSFFILDKLAASVGFIATQGLQIGMIVPHMIDIMRKTGAVSNPIKAVATGLLGGLTMGTGHYVNAYTGKNTFTGFPGTDFFNRAYKYAEDNGITARSVYDESPIESSFGVVGPVAKGLGKTMTVPETYIRAAAFTTLAQLLKDTGKFKNEIDIFREAERRTNMAMVDYASTERPMMFAKMGATGNLLSTLQTYNFNYYNQLSYFVREAAKGNPLPFVAFLGMQYLVAGLMGAPGVEDAHAAYMWVKDNLTTGSQWAKMQQNEFLKEPKLWALKNLGEPAVYGYVSDKSGIGMTSRLAAPSGTQMLSSPVGPAMDIGRQALSAGRAIVQPNATNLSQAAMDLTPPGLQGLVETSPMMEGHTYNTRPDGSQIALRSTKLGQRNAVVDRTPEDVNIRKFGLRSMNEVIQRDVNYANQRDTNAAMEKSKEVMDKFYDAVRRGDKSDAQDYYKTYVYLTGKGISRDQFDAQVKQEFLTNSERNSGNKTLQNLLNLKRAQAIFDSVEKAHANQR